MFELCMRTHFHAHIMRALGHNCMLERIAQSSASDRDLSEVLAHALAPTFEPLTMVQVCRKAGRR